MQLFHSHQEKSCKIDLLNINYGCHLFNLVLNPLATFTYNFISKEDFLLLFVVVCDVIWKGGNAICFSNDSPNIDRDISKVESNFLEFSSTRMSETRTCNLNCDKKKIQKWSPPPLGVLKINVDAASSSNLSVIALVASDYKGVVGSM